jgi:hypothetical protein
MPDQDDLQTRLEDLSAKLDETEGSLKERERWHDGHRLNKGELYARHNYLRAQVEQETRDLEAHGHRVSNLEKSVREWLDSLNLRLE